MDSVFVYNNGNFINMKIVDTIEVDNNKEVAPIVSEDITFTIDETKLDEETIGSLFEVKEEPSQFNVVMETIVNEDLFTTLKPFIVSYIGKRPKSVRLRKKWLRQGKLKVRCLFRDFMLVGEEE